MIRPIVKSVEGHCIHDLACCKQQRTASVMTLKVKYGNGVK